MKKKTVLLIPLLIVLAFCLFGCNQSIPLENTKWMLEQYGESKNLTTVLEETEITAMFDSVEGRVTGSAGCNNYFGSYELDGKKLTLSGPIGSTRMSCGEHIDKQEYEYLTKLETAESYQIKNNELQINCGEQVLIFNQQ